jgi:hypothetical protein
MRPATKGVRHSGSETIKQSGSRGSELHLLQSHKSDPLPGKTKMDPATKGLQRSSSVEAINQSGSRGSKLHLLQSSKSDLFPDLTASDTSTNSSNFGADLLTMAATEFSPIVPPPSLSPTTELGKSQGGNLGESWTTASTDPAGNRLPRISDISPSNSRRRLMRRAASVPANIQASTSPPPPPPSHTSLSTFIVDSKRPILLNSQNADDNLCEDSTIEESWRPAPDKRRILADAIGITPSTNTPLSRKSSLDNFLDALIFDAKRTKVKSPSPGQCYRKRHPRHQQSKSSSQSVGNALDRGYNNRPTSPFEIGSPSSQCTSRPRKHASGAATISGGATLSSYGGTTSHSSQGQSSQEPLRANGADPIVWLRQNRGSQPGHPHPSTLPRRGQPPAPSSLPRRGQRYERGGSLDDSKLSGILSSFLEQEPRHERPTSAHTVSGDPRCISDTVSIAISDGGEKLRTFNVGSREARIIESLLQVSNEMSPSKKAVKTWLVQTAATMQSPSQHGNASITQASDISESDRVSTRSSMLVELSPPLESGNKNDLKAYLDRRRSRDRRTSAFTVAGDRVSLQFKGRSTSELLELLKAEKQSMSAIQERGPPFFEDNKTESSKTRSGAVHPRRGLERRMSVPDMLLVDNIRQSMPVMLHILGGPEDEADDVHDSARIMERSLEKRSLTSTTREDLQSYLDGRSPRSSRQKDGTYSSSGDHADPKMRRHSTSAGPKKRSSSTPRIQRASLAAVIYTSPPNLEDSLTSKHLDLEDFLPPTSARPTNRRSLMRKMQSVPILSNSDKDSMLLGSDTKKSPRRQKSLRSEQKLTRQGSLRRKKKPSRQTSDISDGSRVSKSSRKSKKKSKTDAVEHDGELSLEDLTQSFLDQFLDRDVDGNDSASQMKIRSEEFKEYKASLIDAPIENSASKLRIQPEFLESSQRMILQDPKVNRRDGMKKMKSVNSIQDPSPALKDLYDGENPKPENFDVTSPKPEKATKPPKKGSKKNGKKKNKDKKSQCPKKGKQAAAKQKETPAEPLTPEPPASTAEESPVVDRVTLKDLPRQRKDKTEEVKTPKPLSFKRDKLTKMKSMSQLDKRAYDVADRLLLVARLKTLTNDAPPSPACSPEDSGMAKKPVSERITVQEQGTPKKDPPRTSELHTPSSRKPKIATKPKTPLATQSARARNLSECGGRWSNVPEGVGAGLLDTSHKTPMSEVSKPKSSKKKHEIPKLPFGSVESASAGKDQDILSRHEFEDSLVCSSPPTPPVRKLSRGPMQDKKKSKREDMRKEMSRWSSVPTKLGSPVTPQKTPSRPVSVKISEESIIEVGDDDSVCSELTDGFSFEPMEPEYPRKVKSSRGLSEIKENSEDHQKASLMGTSWADLSHSEETEASKASNFSKERRMHLSKRWQSTSNLSAAVNPDFLKSPVRGIESRKKKGSHERFGWLKKLPFVKKS